MLVNVLIFLLGLAVYAGYGLAGLGYVLGVTLLSYLAGLLISRHKWVLWPCTALHVLALLCVKLQPLLGWELLAPLGISYFTLQILAYQADVYLGKYPPERNLLLYALHITYFPHMLIGPIEPYPSMKEALLSRRFSWEGISQGALRAIWGLFKKLVIASRAGVLVGAISGDPEQYGGAFALAAMVLYSLQLYADFSGGIDIVLGVSRMLGLSLSENFNAPYFSQSIQEFWRRWHITLGAWLRSYVYIPLGGNRKGRLRKYANVIAVFLVSGLWHGIHYLLWGLLNGIFVCLGEKLKTPWKLLNRLGTFLVISFLWCFFIWPDTLTALQKAASVFTTFNYGTFFSALPTLGLTLGDGIVLACAVLILWLRDWKAEAIRDRIRALSPAGITAGICLLGLLVLVFGMYGIGFNASEFIYSKF